MCVILVKKGSQLLKEKVLFAESGQNQVGPPQNAMTAETRTGRNGFNQVENEKECHLCERNPVLRAMVYPTVKAVLGGERIRHPLKFLCHF